MGIYILGMHRSGTSVLTSVVSRLLDQTLPPNPVDSNPGGQRENLAMRPALELLLADQRATWDQPGEPGALHQPRPPTDRRARKAFARSLPEPFIWKDPRLCLTIDYWLDLPQDSPRIIVIHRHPLEVANSLRERNGMDVARGLALWQRTNRHLILRLAGRTVYNISYESLTQDTVPTAAKLGEWLEAPTDRVSSAADLVNTDNSSNTTFPTRIEGATTELHRYLNRTAGQTSFAVSELPTEGAPVAAELGNPGRVALAKNRMRAFRASLHQN